LTTVYLGTSPFAAAVLERLARSAHRPSLVVTRPDRPAGRGRQLTSPPVLRSARALGIPVAQPDDVNEEDARAAIAAVEPEVVVVCAFGALIREPLLSSHELLNVHPSLLPRWRGAAPVERAIMAGDAETGVAIMRLTAGLDSGPVALRCSLPIAPDDTYGSLSARLAQLGADLLIQTLDERPGFEEQDEAAATYAEKITSADRTLDPSLPAVHLDRVVRALTPHIGARVALADGSFLGVVEARVVEGSDAVPGSVIEEDGRLLLSTADGALELTVVQPPGGRPMPAADYLRGRRR
jgi:methionyl-tRNA formyltransferase